MNDTKAETLLASIVAKHPRLAVVLRQIYQNLRPQPSPKTKTTETADPGSTSKRRCTCNYGIRLCEDSRDKHRPASAGSQSLISDASTQLESQPLISAQVSRLRSVTIHYTRAKSHHRDGSSSPNAAHSSSTTVAHSDSRRQTRNASGLISDSRRRWKPALFWALALFIALRASTSHASPAAQSPDRALRSLQRPTADSKLYSSLLSRGTRASTRPGGKPRRSRRLREVPDFVSQHNKVQRLLTRSSYFLEILKNGKIRGTTDRSSPYNLVRLESISAGVLAIFGNKSGRYLAMNRKGKLYGAKAFNDDCKFLEKIVNNQYFYYQAVPVPTSGRRRRRKKVKPRYVGFDKNGRPKKGQKIKNTNKGALFFKYVESKRRG